MDREVELDQAQVSVADSQLQGFVTKHGVAETVVAAKLWSLYATPEQIAAYDAFLAKNQQQEEVL